MEGDGRPGGRGGIVDKRPLRRGGSVEADRQRLGPGKHLRRGCRHAGNRRAIASPCLHAGFKVVLGQVRAASVGTAAAARTTAATAAARTTAATAARAAAARA